MPGEDSEAENFCTLTFIFLKGEYIHLQSFQAVDINQGLKVRRFRNFKWLSINLTSFVHVLYFAIKRGFGLVIGG